MNEYGVMNCEKAEMLFAQLLFDDFEENLKEPLEKHVKSCKSCSKKIGTMRLTERLLRESWQMDFDVELSAEKKEKIRSQYQNLSQREKQTPVTRVWFRKILAIAALLLVTFGLYRSNLSYVYEEKGAEQAGLTGVNNLLTENFETDLVRVKVENPEAKVKPVEKTHVKGRTLEGLGLNEVFDKSGAVESSTDSVSEGILFGSVTCIQGDVSVYRNGLKLVVLENMSLMQGDEIQTKLHSMLAFQMSEGNDLVLSSESTVVLKTGFSLNDEKIKVELHAGTLRCRLDNLEERRFSVVTDVAEAKVTGTDFVTRYSTGDQGKMTLTVLRGSVVVNSTAGNSVVKDGEEIEVGEKDSAPAPVRISLSRIKAIHDASPFSFNKGDESDYDEIEIPSNEMMKWMRDKAHHENGLEGGVLNDAIEASQEINAGGF